MIRTLLDVIPAGNRKYPIRYRRAINVMYSRLDYLRFRFLNTEMTNSPGLNLLKSLLLNVDMNDLDSYPNDIDRFIYVIQSYKQSRLNQFDPVYSGKFFSDYFTNRGRINGTTEILLDVDTDKPLTTFPLDKDWSEWQYLRGLRIISYDSLELPETITSSLITFNRDAPTIIIMTIDVPVLLFKYYKYWKNCKEAEIECDITDFLKRYEYANFFSDLLDAWFMNLMPYAFTAGGRGVQIREVISNLTVPTRVATDNVLIEVVGGLNEYSRLYQQNSLKPQDMIDTPWFPSGQTIREKIDTYLKACRFPQQRNYRWCEALFWLPFIDIITSSLIVFPSSPVSNQIAAKFRVLWRDRYRATNLPNIARGFDVKEVVENVGNVLHQILDERAS